MSAFYCGLRLHQSIWVTSSYKRHHASLVYIFVTAVTCQRTICDVDKYRPVGAWWPPVTAPLQRHWENISRREGPTNSRIQRTAEGLWHAIIPKGFLHADIQGVSPHETFITLHLHSHIAGIAVSPEGLGLGLRGGWVFRKPLTSV